MIPEPSCSRCGTDNYLLIHAHKPARSYQREIRTGMRPIYRTETEGAEARFHCMKCGRFNGHTVPAGWAPRLLSESEKSEILTSLGRKQGFAFPSPHSKNIYDDEGRLKSVKHGSFG